MADPPGFEPETTGWLRILIILKFLEVQHPIRAR